MPRRTGHAWRLKPRAVPVVRQAALLCAQALLWALPGGSAGADPAGNAHFSTATLKGQISVRTWKDFRDERIVKQDLDYSCGAASVATIMNGFYGMAVTEAELLDAMEDDGVTSFQDLADVVRAHGLKGIGVALNFEQLRQLKVPAIAYLRYRDDDHFSVIRGIEADGHVTLADPAWGNRRFTRHQFLAMWETRTTEDLKGKVLLILPDGVDTARIDRSFFGAAEPNRVTKEILMLRY